MYKTIDSVKRAARKGEIVSLSGLKETDKRKVLKVSGFPTNCGTMYVPGFDGQNHYLKHVKL